MKKSNKNILIIIIFLVLILTVLANSKIFASNTLNSESIVEYSEEYSNWLKLSDEEKQNFIIPRMYDVSYTKLEYQNPLYKAKMLKSSFSSRFSLKDLISSNLAIRDQLQTGSCWAFAALSSLETNLALSNYKNNTNLSKIYDFSERHLEYATSRVFNNNQINPIGYNRVVGSGGNWIFASSYLTNGSGAINEDQMPFENNENSIDISQIQNKTVTSQVYDTIEFPNYHSTLIDPSETTEIINQVKSHIQNYGSVYAGIVAGGSFMSSSKISATTGAVAVGGGGYADHAVSIIGWDDNYSKENWNEFDENYRPETDGAWIARNSWGTALTEDGLIYISYEDETASLELYGVVKSDENINYDNIYQYDYYYPNYKETCGEKMMLCNIFDRKSNETEYLTQVALHSPETSTCRVYVNPNGTGMEKEDFQLVSLKEGESETFSAGYHTLEFAKPLAITSNQFAVAIEISSVDGSSTYISSIRQDSNLYSPVEVESGKCFMLDTWDYRNKDDWSGWEDLAEDNILPPRISTIKAFTTTELIDESLKSIEIVTPPNKTSYFEGENFDKTGMVIRANYNSKTNPSVILDSSSYNITNGTNLKVGQTSVTITYEDKSIEQTINVEENTVTELKITTPPSKTEYKEGQSFDKTGMVVEATYKDGTSQPISDYIIEDGNNLKPSQTYIIISYGEQKVEQPITVTPNPLIKIDVTKVPDKTNYVVGQNFDKTGMIVTGTYQDETTQEILDYTISDGTNLSIDQSYVTIEYDGKTTTQAITVEEKSIIEISVVRNPTKMQYIQNKEELDLTGGILKISYNDNSNEEISLTSEEITVSGFDNTRNRYKCHYYNISISYYYIKYRNSC